MPIVVRVRLFARMREICGASEVELRLQAPATLQDVFEEMAARHPGIGGMQERLLVARNEEYAEWGEAVTDADTVAFIPPVSGGNVRTGGIMVKVGTDPIVMLRLRDHVASARAGAIVAFEGVVRNHHQGTPVAGLEYEAYLPMAERQLRVIAATARERFDVERIAMVHRFGSLLVGDISVGIAVSAAHRRPAIAAMEYLIDTLKQRAPIWKKETGPDGSFWIEGPEQIRARD